MATKGDWNMWEVYSDYNVIIHIFSYALVGFIPIG